jgi:hypothetical protein
MEIVKIFLNTNGKINKLSNRFDLLLFMCKIGLGLYNRSWTIRKGELENTVFAWSLYYFSLQQKNEMFRAKNKN